MSAVITAPFGNAKAANEAAAANATFARALKLGYSRTCAQQFARVAKRGASEWEPAQQTALRVVLPKTATFAGNPGGAA